MQDKELNYCPVCNKVCDGHAGISSHLFKTREEMHQNFIIELNQKIKEEFYTDISCEALSEKLVYIRPTYVCNEWAKMPGYKERKLRMNSLSLQKQWKNGERQIPAGFTRKSVKYNPNDKGRISEEQCNMIVSFFNSDLAIIEIAEKVKCNPKTVRYTFVRYFGEKETQKRGKLILSKNIGGPNRLEIINPDLVEKIKNEFNSEKGLFTLKNELNSSSCAIIRIWTKHFGKEEYKKRAERSRQRALLESLKTLGNTGQAGSKPEIDCFEALSKKLDCEVVHHDFSIIPPYEIDISIPSLKIAVAWDGVFHRRVIFNEESYNKTVKRDIKKKEMVLNAGWKYIVIEDDQRKSDEQLISKTVDQIILSINKPDNYIVIRNDS